MRTRAQDAGEREASLAFRVWWASVALISLSQGLRLLLAFAGVREDGVFIGLDQWSMPFFFSASFGILYYVTYVHTGNARLLAPLAAYYLALYALLRVHLAVSRPVGARVERWNVVIEYAHSVQGPVYTALVASVAIPILLAVLGYASLLRQVHAPRQRYQIGLASAGLLVWVLTEALAFASGVVDTAAGELTRRFVGLGSAAVMLVAYRPPRLVRERLGE